MITSYAQNFEDVMLWRALAHVEHGFYIDIGAQDPRVDSVSLLFYERGWRGIHVEPVPRYAEALRQHRPDETVIQAAVANQNDVLRFYEIPGTGISTAAPDIAAQHRERGFESREIVVPCTTLESIFELGAGRDIHWLKIDVEGFERQVLESWNGASERPWIVVVESTWPMTQIERHDEWESTLVGLGYCAVYFDGLNRYYVSERHGELKQAFHAPPNVFDDFALSGESNAPFHRQIVERDRAALDAAQAELRRLDEDSRARILALNDELESASARSAEQARVTLEKAVAAEQAFRQQEQQWAARDRERSYEHALLRTKLEDTLKSAVLREQDARRQLLEASAKADAALAAQASEHARREREWQAARVEHERRLADAMQSAQSEIRLHSEALWQRDAQTEDKLARQALSLRKEAEAERSRLAAVHALTLAELRRAHLDERETQRAAVERLQAARAALEMRHEVFVRDLEQEKTTLAQRYENLLRESEGQRIRREQQAASDLSFLQSRLDRRNGEYDELRSKYEAEADAHARHAHALAERNAEYLWEGYRLGRAERARGWFARAFSFVGRGPKLDVRYLAAPIEAKCDAASAKHRVDRMKMLKINFQPEFVVREDGKYNLDDFLSLHDRNFVRAAYLALLNREPDEYGERHYLSRVRAGVSKIQILSDIQKSKEARKRGAKIAHLKGAVFVNKLFGIPVIGGLIQGTCFFFSVNRHLKDLRALENHLIRMGEEMQQHYQGYVESSIKSQGTGSGK
ncbi:FkbM family methyltransferase [Burkholderia thailandensis]|uniref:FkbM family methyltransferase n=1 Tax=Burkholderia thailandensis TaxID=57975 RepID=UPI0012E719BC|nr:FkbM family methyltransferase [Burkholderia thailandensis]MCS6492816.1 FkbM family methyltransferase [Burkholderia thailandensis]MUV22179.1 FkbM family methyltransferase [Burkholderia thailandensis]WRS66496.1 FkbM family methyltransferase [Burkholderia thailandensis]